MEEKEKNFQKVSFITVTEKSDGQRIDNFLMRELGSVPRSYVYRILRKGEVRVDKKRVKPERKLRTGEVVRVPPVYIREKQHNPLASEQQLKQLEEAILLEDEDIILINKPSGLPVHAGSGYELGLIELFRQLRPNIPFVELAHRLDKDTSGILILAKNRQALQELHRLFKAAGIDKRYQTLVAGKWRGGVKHVRNELVKRADKREKMQVGAGGKNAESIFKPRKIYRDISLLDVKLLTGRMHQIRAQLAHMRHPVIGDDRYGDFERNRHYKKVLGLRRLFLHAWFVDFHLAFSGRRYHVEIPLAEDLARAIEHYDE